MVRRGVTLLEVLADVVIVSIVGVSATISFGNIEQDTSEEDLKNKYIEIQRSANLYMDLHNSDIEWFLSNKEIYYKIATLKGENYISSDLSNPVTGEDIDSNYYVKVYMVNEDDPSIPADSPYKNIPVRTNYCIVDKTINETTGMEEETCIADHLGNYKDLGTNCCK